MKKLWIIIMIFLFCSFATVSFGRGYSRSSRSFSSGSSRSFSSGRTSRSSGSFFSKGNSGSFFSKGNSRSFSKGNGNKTSSWGSKKSFSTSGKRSSSKSSSMSRADKRLYERAKTHGRTVFSNRTTAMKSFRSKYASNYRSTFKTRPTTRPAYIRSTVVVNHVSRPVIFYHGSYGYYNTMGTFIIYDPWLYNAAYMNAQMAQQGYYVGPPPQTTCFITTLLN